MCIKEKKKIQIPSCGQEQNHWPLLLYYEFFQTSITFVRNNNNNCHCCYLKLGGIKEMEGIFYGGKMT